ncbi:MAG TPA: nickel pincer cofactor biosynthesis protein LarC [Pyrinomonadaceae bacterium]|nr:nickel pincer cofactor biosynthesis protein LarC [Chloracidobacterium sp.]MBP9936683.1 nickel pincer cofactor biosynthesis protein LarC [Pyrinomonadaceae bacterium]MBK9439291.1 nickel pincer cofactor biosynthesis protein LarC [Chloracidobacterium sp.]MBL0239417.1 nickel pincer cofactor biosynthesis protein LarC [Chloracidobacterium sp.]HQX55643.1 nickel pincer cofactor biosynthesis protein LarC [Pyrinomonadaceae bacterium]
MRTLYFDCFAGASGNMILGALIAAGVHAEGLKTELRKLQISEFDIEVSTVDRSGITSTHVDVRVPHEHVHRHLHNIVDIIDRTDLSDSVKSRSRAIFTRLAEAEAKIHGIEVGKVHFHEVGAMDAIVDVVGSCIGFEMLGIERFTCSKVHVGSGFAQMAHGKFPIPPPAVAELLTGVPIYSTEIEGELMTPTGAAIISTVCDTYGRVPEMSVAVTAYGAGTRQYEGFPNALRIMVGDSEVASTGESGATDELLVIETNIDDISPQILGYVMERVFEIGALDCWFTPIQMKKNRPATMVSILCDREHRRSLTELLYNETTTIGIRVRSVERECLERKTITVATVYGDIDIKIARHKGRVVNIMPEYDQVKAAATEHKTTFHSVREAAVSQFAEYGISEKAVA